MQDHADTYEEELRRLQIELVKLQRHLISLGEKVLVIVEGRDAAGKDGAIKRVVEHMSPRDTRVVALGKPSERDNGSWYFQRWVAHLPAAGEFVLFNRSWYNRAGVERVMGFCSDADCRDFLESVPHFEDLLQRGGIRLIKYYLDISRAEQKQRLEDRRNDPLAQWKTSPIDDVALKHWRDYSRARNVMLAHTHTDKAPWMIVRANKKKRARLNLMRDLLTHWAYSGKLKRLAPDRNVVFPFTQSCLKDGELEA